MDLLAPTPTRALLGSALGFHWHAMTRTSAPMTHVCPRLVVCSLLTHVHAPTTTHALLMTCALTVPALASWRVAVLASQTGLCAGAEGAWEPTAI